MAIYNGNGTKGIVQDLEEIRSSNAQSFGLWKRLYSDTEKRTRDPNGRPGFKASNVRRWKTSNFRTRQFQRLNFEEESAIHIAKIQKSDFHVIKHVKFGDVTLKQFEDTSYTDSVWRELDLLGCLNHENVSRLLGAFYDGNPFLVFEPICGFLTNCKLSESIVFKVFVDLLQATKYLQSKNIVHCNIRPETIMVTRRGHFAISSFSESLKLQESETKKRTGVTMGSPKYLNKQALSENYYSNQTDIWSLTCTLFNLTTGNDFVLPAGFENTEKNCLEVIEKGFPTNRTDGTCQRQKLSERIQQCKYGNILFQLLDDVPRKANVPAMVLESDSFKRLERECVRSVVINFDVCKNWFEEQKQELDTKPLVNYPFVDGQKLVDNSVAFIRFYYEFCEFPETTTDTSVDTEQQESAKEFLENFDEWYDLAKNGDVEKIERASKLLAEVLKME